MSGTKKGKPQALAVLDLQPKWSGEPGKSDVLTTLSAEVNETIEQFVVRSTDLKMFVVKSLAALAYQDERAREIFEANFHYDDIGQPLPWDAEAGDKITVRSEEQPVSDVPVPANAKVISLACVRRFGTTRLRNIAVVGGYARSGRVILMALDVEGDRPMSLLRIGPKGCLMIVPASNEKEYLRFEDWAQFLRMRQSAFTLAGKEWTKLKKRDIERVLRRKQFVLSAPIRKREVLRGDGGVESIGDENSRPANSDIELPNFALDLLKQQACPYCRLRYGPADVHAAGARRSARDKMPYFFYETECRRCRNPAMTLMSSRGPMDMRQVANLYIDGNE